MAENIPDFRFSRQLDVGNIAALLADKKVKEEQLRLAQEQNKRAKTAQLIDMAQLGVQLASAGIDISQKRQEMKAAKTKAQATSELADLLPRLQGQEPGRLPEKGPLPIGAFPEIRPPAGEELLGLAQQKAVQAGIGLPELGKTLFPQSAEAQRGNITGRDSYPGWMIGPGNERISVNKDKVSGDVYDNLTGDLIPADERRRLQAAGWKFVPRTKQEEDAAGNILILDPTGRVLARTSTGAPEVPKSKYGTVTSFNDPSIPTKDRKFLFNEITKLRDNRNINLKKAQELVTTATNVERLLKENNKVAIDRLGGLIQKLVALDSGNLAAWEQRDPNSRDIINRSKQFVRLRATGLLEPKVKEELISLLSSMRSNMAQNLQEQVGIGIDSLIEQFPQLNEEALYRKTGLLPYFEYIKSGTPDASATGIPKVGEMFNGAKVINVRKVR